MPEISDLDLKKRLTAHNYPVPPITVTTRGLLQKKLAQLDGEIKSSKEENIVNSGASSEDEDIEEADEESEEEDADVYLRKRLKSHNYSVPPITYTTRGFLQKKLAQLDRESKASNEDEDIENEAGEKDSEEKDVDDEHNEKNKIEDIANIGASSEDEDIEEANKESEEEDADVDLRKRLRSHNYLLEAEEKSENCADNQDIEEEDMVNSGPSRFIRKLIIVMAGFFFLIFSMQLFLNLIHEYPQWRVKILQDKCEETFKNSLKDKSVNMKDREDEKITENNKESFTFDKTYLSLVNPINWQCWIRLQAIYMYSFGMKLLINITYVALVLVFVYGAYRIYSWRQKQKIKEQQEVFELVEKALSMLFTRHQQYHALAVVANTSQTSGNVNNISKQCLAVNHIRDQIIPPTDRKRKQHIWSQVVKYIRESESRVREDVQAIYGEEHLVWQWIPDIHWSPMTHPGPNPYPYSTPPRLQASAQSPVGILSPHTLVANASSFPHPHSNAGSPPNTMITPTMPSNYKHHISHPSSTSTPVSPPAGTPKNSWQGAAFNSLNRNVAAPTVAPTSCLKIRHMFDPQHVSSNSPRANNQNSKSHTGWIWQVKEEILRRCSATNPPASILHIAVDTENIEGCVYVKAQNTEEAGKVFRTLHGQWYRGNLVTVKYLREERYHERFPDAKHQRIPLRASIQVQRL